MPNAWTGGQYSVFRVAMALWLIVQLALLGRGEDVLVQVTVSAGAALGVLLGVGWRDHAAAAGLLVVWLLMLVLRPELMLVVEHRTWAWIPPLVLLLHLLTPAEPFGSVDAMGRPDPDEGWRMHPRVYAAGWAALAAYYLVHGWLWLGQPAWRLGLALWPDGLAGLPLELTQVLTWALLGAWLAFAPLALVRTTRPLAWGAVLVVNAVALPLAGMGELTAALAVLHLFTFDPGWLAVRRPKVPETLYYDGACGLCHRAARFVLAEDRAGCFELAPLGGEHFRRTVPEAKRRGLPDSVVVLRDDGALLVRSTAVLHLMDRLGGLWRVLAWLGRALPRRVRDWGYDRVASVRGRLFAAPAEACPLMPPHLRGRFHP